MKRIKWKSGLPNDINTSTPCDRDIGFREATTEKYWGMGPCGSFQGGKGHRQAWTKNLIWNRRWLADLPLPTWGGGDVESIEFHRVSLCTSTSVTVHVCFTSAAVTANKCFYFSCMLTVFKTQFLHHACQKNRSVMLCRSLVSGWALNLSIPDGLRRDKVTYDDT